MRRHRTTLARIRRRRGAATVEFAIVAPIFFLLVFGLMEIARMVMIQQAVTNAAREGCRKAVLATTIDPNEVTIAARSAMTNIVLDTNKVRVDPPTNLSQNTASGTELTVRVELDYDDVSWLGFLGVNPTLGAEVSQERE